MKKCRPEREPQVFVRKGLRAVGINLLIAVDRRCDRYPQTRFSYRVLASACDLSRSKQLVDRTVLEARVQVRLMYFKVVDRWLVGQVHPSIIS